MGHYGYRSCEPFAFPTPPLKGNAVQLCMNSSSGSVRIVAHYAISNNGSPRYVSQHLSTIALVGSSHCFVHLAINQHISLASHLALRHLRSHPNVSELPSTLAWRIHRFLLEIAMARGSVSFRGYSRHRV